MKKLTLFFALATLILVSPVVAAGIFPGYGKTPWGADVKSVKKTYSKGTLSKMAHQEIYKQLKPSSDVKQRSFAFTNNKLVAVSVTMDPVYVTKNGIEKLLEKQKKLYGEGLIDRSGAPHMLTYRWQDQSTRITFAYAPQKPEMTVLMYEKK
ncbi:MAG: hypothetical protein HXX17_04840 [Geobacteraceae bacterium]|nr:hypothetical protein [Geobacteraceae bacterium]